MAIRRFTHVGVSVTDLERSTRFYCLALGFQRSKMTFEAGSSSGPLFGVSRLELRIRFLQREDIRLELLEFTEPALKVDGGLLPLYRQGFTHLCFKVDDVDETAALIEKFGGGVHPEHRIKLESDDFVQDNLMCSDPDGAPIELSKDYPQPPGFYEFEPYVQG
jgi:catechol 2,3-dioxygenase-like lactoylglutathione lyase family enzyme